MRAGIHDRNVPRKPRFVSGVKRHVSKKSILSTGMPRLVGGEHHYGIVQQRPSAVYYACVQPVKSSFCSPRSFLKLTES